MDAEKGTQLSEACDRLVESAQVLMRVLEQCADALTCLSCGAEGQKDKQLPCGH